MPAPIDAVELEVVRASLAGIVQEMQNSLFRTGFSTIVRESQDASCALMNANGEVVAQHVVLPLHIGAFPACTAAVIAAFGGGIADGSAFIINHPYHGGSPHAPDTPSSRRPLSELFGFCGSIAHKSDIGGPVPGSVRARRGRPHEGLHLPAIRYQSGYRRIPTSSASSPPTAARPELVRDIRGQLGADRLGERRLTELAGKFGKENCACFGRLLDLSESTLKAAIAEWADGRFEAERFVDDDGIDLERPVRVHVVVTKAGDALPFDFSGSADQTKGPANIRPPLVQAACAYALISLIDPSLRVERLAARLHHDGARRQRAQPALPGAGQYLQSDHPRAGRRHLDAMSHTCPARCAPTQRQPSIILGAATPYRQGYVQYEIIAGGAGARASKDGIPASPSTRATPGSRRSRSSRANSRPASPASS
jgi:N-methylhydantoinase B